MRWLRYIKHLFLFAWTTDPSHSRECEHYRHTLFFYVPRD